MLTCDPAVSSGDKAACVRGRKLGSSRSLRLPPPPRLVRPSRLARFASLLLSSARSSARAVGTLALHSFHPSVGALILKFSASSRVLPAGTWVFLNLHQVMSRRRERRKRCSWAAIRTLDDNAAHSRKPLFHRSWPSSLI